MRHLCEGDYFNEKELNKLANLNLPRGRKEKRRRDEVRGERRDGEKGAGLKSRQQESGMGNDNEARRDVIISRLPNRSEPKTTASATGEKSIPSIAPSRGGITRQN